jgi:DNA-binding transcriptional LysR family regulator
MAGCRNREIALENAINRPSLLNEGGVNFQQLRYAAALAECGSFVAAAAKCCVTQPTLSNAVAQLEQELGQPLFARTTRKVQLTRFGEDILPSLHDVLNAQAALVAQATRLLHPARRLVRLGVSPLIGMTTVRLLLEPFQRRNPDVDFIFRELNLAEMLRQLRAGQLECVLGPVDHDAPPDAGVETTPLYSEPLVYAAQGLDGRATSGVTLADIAPETFVMVPDACGLARATRGLFGRSGFTLKEYGGQALSYRVLREWAEAGIGSAILPASVMPPGSGAPIQLDGANGTARIDLQALWLRASPPRPEMALLARYLIEAAPTLLQGLSQPPARR